IRDFHVTGVQTCALPICEGQQDEDHQQQEPGRRVAGPELEHEILVEDAPGAAHAATAPVISRYRASTTDPVSAVIGVSQASRPRSEERRVGKVCRSVYAG